MLRFLLVSILLTWVPIYFTQAQQSPYAGLPFVRNFKTVEYKAGIQNWDIAQDKRGIIYIANNFGLLEFDGSQWQIFGVPNGTKVRSVAIDQAGKIYVGCQGDFGYFFPNSRGELIYTSLADSLKPEFRNFDETWSVYIDQQHVYFCTFSRLYQYDVHANTFVVIEPRHPIDLSFLVNRKLLVNEREAGVTVLHQQKLITQPGGNFFNGMSVSSILPLHTEELLVSTFQHGVYIWRGNTVTPWNKATHDFLKAANVNCMVRLRNGNFAAGTQNDGLLILDPAGNILQHMTHERGLENRTVLCLYEDDLNNLWVGQNNGIAYIELGYPFTFINEQTGLPGTGYAAFLDGEDLYLGTNTGLYKKSKQQQRFTLIENTRGQVYHVGRYGNDLLVGHHTGAFRIGQTKGEKISNEPGSWIFMPVGNAKDKLIEGTYNGLQLYTKNQNQHWSLRHKLRGFNESSRVMAEDSNGDLWITHGYKGVFKLTFAEAMDSVLSVKYYGAEKGFPTPRLINVFKIRNDLLFTSERGVFKYNAAKDFFERDELFTSRLGEDVQLWSMQEDALGNIYFIGVNQIGFFQRNASGEYLLHTQDFQKIRKYLNDDLENITILRNNEVLFGSKDGFIHFDPTRIRNQESAFNTLIRKVHINYEHDSLVFSGNYTKGDSVVLSQATDDHPEFSYKLNSVSFAFTAPIYESDNDVQYQYYLENYEKGWSDWMSRTEKEYTNLKEGHYRFHVRARNSNGTIGNEAVYSFSIVPPWYRSIAAYSVYTIIIFAFLFAGFSLLDRKYQREQQRLEEEKDKELSEKDTQLEQLSMQSQEEINRLKTEKLEAELHHMNTELATSTMHLLNKNEFITGIKQSLGQIVKKTNDDVRKELMQIAKEIENNISADADWEHFQFHFDRVHGDFTNRFKSTFPQLSPQEIKLSAYLRMNLSTKEIAQLLNISIRGVEISRYRLRKKLQLDRNQNLQDFILNF